MNTARSAKSWRDFPALLPLKCNRHKIVSHQKRLFVTGGENSEENKISDAIYEISITSPQSPKIVCHMPEPRVGHGAILHDNKVQRWINLDYVNTCLAMSIGLYQKGYFKPTMSCSSVWILLQKTLSFRPPRTNLWANKFEFRRLGNYHKTYLLKPQPTLRPNT